MLELDAGWRSDFEGQRFAHGAVVVTGDGLVVTTDPDEARLDLWDPVGRLHRTIPTHAVEAHGLALSKFDSSPTLWIADPGFKVVVRGTEATVDRVGNGRVFAIDFETGEVVIELEQPTHPLYSTMLYRPTSVALESPNQKSYIWVADGYGASLVHRYDPAGRYVESLDGAAGEGRFDCPHSVQVCRRGDQDKLYITDRGNHRMQVFSLDGTFDHSFGHGHLASPTGCTDLGGFLVVADLEARLVVFDKADSFQCTVGADEKATKRPGWPNKINEHGVLGRPDDLVDGKLNSPHAIGASGSSSVYVVEYIIGGRLTRFRATNKPLEGS